MRLSKILLVFVIAGASLIELSSTGMIILAIVALCLFAFWFFLLIKIMSVFVEVNAELMESEKKIEPHRPDTHQLPD